MIRIKQILFHIAVICGLVCITARILDWYNPYMDFGGHLVWAGMVGSMAAVGFVILTAIVLFRKNLEMKRKYHHRYHRVA